MARYIDADKFEKECAYLRARLEFSDGTKTNGWWAVLTSVQIKDAPTEDVVPVVHAHWRKRPISRFYDLVNYWMTGLKPCECSRCECPCGNELMRYCPVCGAKMDEEVGK